MGHFVYYYVTQFCLSTSTQWALQKLRSLEDIQGESCHYIQMLKTPLSQTGHPVNYNFIEFGLSRPEMYVSCQVTRSDFLVACLNYNAESFFGVPGTFRSITSLENHQEQKHPLAFL